MSTMATIVAALTMLALIAVQPSASFAQTRPQVGDSVRYRTDLGDERSGTVVSVAVDTIEVLEGQYRRHYPLVDLDGVRVRTEVPGARERGFWMGAIIGGAVVGTAALLIALDNLPYNEVPDPRNPSDTKFVLAMTTGGGMLGGLTFGIVGALLASDHRWVAVQPNGMRRDGSVDIGFRIGGGWIRR